MTTAPLTPADCDLRAYDWFPFYHKQLRGSAFWKNASDAACRISVELWSEAYEQVPAASLPDDDRQLSDWAGFGRRDLGPWLQVKDEVMAPWVKCADGRWYHPVLSKVACAAWADRRLHLWQRECDRIRKENKRREKDGLPLLPLPDRPDVQATSDGTPDFSSGKDDVSAGNPPEDTQTSAGNPAEIALKGTGTGTGILEATLETQAREPVADWPDGMTAHWAAKLTQLAGPGLADPHKEPGLVLSAGEIARWRLSGCSWREDIVPTIQRLTATARPGGPIQTWAYFNKPVMAAMARRNTPLAIPTIEAGAAQTDDRPSPSDARRDASARYLQRQLAAAMEDARSG